MSRLVTIAIALLLTGACTNQQIYDAAQQNRALECQKYPDTRYEECMATVEKDYEEYEREREKAAKEP